MQGLKRSAQEQGDCHFLAYFIPFSPALSRRANELAMGVGHDDKKVPASDRVKILTREETRWSHCLDTRLYRIYSYNYAGKIIEGALFISADARTDGREI